MMEATLEKQQYFVEGMTCASCAVSLETYLKHQEGIEDASVSYANKSVSVAFDPNLITPDEIDRAAREIGYHVLTSGEESGEASMQARENKRLHALRNQLLISAVFSVPVFVLSMFFMGRIVNLNWILLGLSLPVMIFGGREFFVNAWKRLRHGTTNMDTLVALSTGIAFSFSAFNTVYPEFLRSQGLEPHVYFESAVIIITLILLGRYLEERAKTRTTTAIKSLMNLQPERITVIRNGEEVILPLKEVITGDMVVVKPGERIPVDGKVRKGDSYVDESMMTGEPVAVHKIRGDEVLAGTLNKQGSLRVLAQSVGQETFLAGIIRRVREAQATKPPIQKLVDKIASVFVPAVILIALVAFFIWFFTGPEPRLTYSFLILITVLIIACPCALGLATPTALMVGIGKGAGMGILIKDAQSLESAYKTEVLVLDKTGTITRGEPVVSREYWVNKPDDWERKLLAAVEKSSEHPLAEAILTHFSEAGESLPEPDSFHSITSMGVEAEAEGRNILIGNEALFKNKGISLPGALDRECERFIQEGYTTILIAIDGSARGILGISDELRADSREAVRKLQEMNVEVHILSGDNQEATDKVARQVNVSFARGNMSPADKGRYIGELMAAGRKVAVAGDGINDAEALARADVGIAMGSGTDVAMESAGITLMYPSLSHLSEAIELSRATMKTIHQNLFWAFIYNLIAIPVAAGLLYPFTGFLLNPMIAGAAMAMSSISVVLNSLRLNKLNIN